MSDRKKEMGCWIVAILFGAGVLIANSRSSIILEWLCVIPFGVAFLSAIFYDLKSRFTSFFQRFRR